MATKTLTVELELAVQPDADPFEVLADLLALIGDHGGKVTGLDGVVNGEALDLDGATL